MFKVSSLIAALTTALLSSCLAVAPAIAEDSVLPSGANGTDNSRITALLCDSSLHMRLPVVAEADPAFHLQRKFNNMQWDVSINGTEVISIESGDYSNYWADDVFGSGQFAPEIVSGESATLTLTASDSDANVSESFDMVVQKIDDTFSGGTGTRANPYLISSVDELNAIRCYSNKYFKLVEDIDLSEVNWLPIGSENGGSWNAPIVNEWRGFLDGDGHKILNLELSGINDYVGLFGVISHYVIQDLNLINFDVEGVKFVGAVAGRALNGQMSNVKVKKSTVTGVESVGLLAGKAEYESAFDNITVRGKVFAKPRIRFHWDRVKVDYVEMRYIGGVVGAEEGDGTVWTNTSADVDIEVLDVENRIDGQVFVENAKIKVFYVGGLVGQGYEGYSFSQAKVKSEISLSDDPLAPSSSWYIGGLIGNSQQGLVSNVVVEAKITDDGYGDLDRVGGVIGNSGETHFANIKSTTILDLESGFEDSDTSDENDVRDVGGVFGQDGYDNTLQYFESKSDVKIVRLGGRLSRVGGFMGYEYQTQIYDVNSYATLDISDANGTNNSLGLTLSNPQGEWMSFGGFTGQRSTYLSHTRVSSVSDVTITGAPVSKVGGYFGYQDGRDGFSLRNAVVRGSVTVPAGSSAIGALVGSSGAIRLGNVLISTDLKLNGSTENVGSPIGEYLFEGQELSRYFDTFSDSAYDTAVDSPTARRTATKMKSSKFLRANGFDLVNVFRHKEGKFPIIRMQLPTLNNETLRKGRTNLDTSISVGALKKNGSRSYFVNLDNVNARQIASLYVIRNGKKIKLIHTAQLNMVGNWYVTSRFDVRVGDVLQVEISGKVLRKITL